MKIEISENDQKVFAIYDDGNVLVPFNPELLHRVTKKCRDAISYVGSITANLEEREKSLE